MSKKTKASYQIDQSGRVEYTSHDTVIAISNGERNAILIKAKDKRYLQQVFRKMGKNNIFVFRVFSLLIVQLVKITKCCEELTIDLEYPGRESQIKNYILEDLKNSGSKINTENIKFGRIGKKSEAHWHAYYVFKKKRKAEIVITAKEVLNYLFH